MISERTRAIALKLSKREEDEVALFPSKLLLFGEMGEAKTGVEELDANEDSVEDRRNRSNLN